MKTGLRIFLAVVLLTGSTIAESAAGVETRIENGVAAAVFPEYAISEDGQVIAILLLREQKTGKNLDLLTSTDGGQTWKSQTSIAKRVSTWNFKVEVSKSGNDITVVWIEDGLDTGIWLKNSKDSGKNWNQDQLIETPNARYKNRLKLSQSRDGSTKLITYFASAINNSSFQTFFQNSSIDGGRTWMFTNNNRDDIKQPYGDSKVSDDGRVLAYTYESYGNKTTQGQLRFSISKDGLNWSKETTIDTGNAFSPNNRIVVLKENQLVINYDNNDALLVSNDNGLNFKKLQLPKSGFLKNVWTNENLSHFYVSSVESTSNGRVISFTASTDFGNNWMKPVKVIDGVDNESSLVVSSDGKTLAMLSRSWGSESVFLQMSRDIGKTWSPPKKINSTGERIHIAFEGQGFGTYLDETQSKILVMFNAVNIATNSYSQSLERIPYYLLEFEGNENTSGVVPEALISVNGSPITIPAKSNDFHKLHFSFMGWSRGLNSQEGPLLPGQVISELSSNLKLYADWKELPNFNLVFHDNKILSKTPGQLKVWEDSSFSIPKVDQQSVKSGVTFLYWSTEPNGKGRTLKAGQNLASFYFANKLSGELNLYAVGKSTLTKTIICSKGKQIKKVTALNPRCPVSYKKK